MNKLKRGLAVLFAVCLSVAIFTFLGCGGLGGDSQEQESQTQTVQSDDSSKEESMQTNQSESLDEGVKESEWKDEDVDNDAWT